MAGGAIYGATKAAVAGLVRGWARDLGPRNILVNVIQPGPVDTDMNPAEGALAETLRPLTALGRYGKPEEIDNPVAFLASDEASYITAARRPRRIGLARPINGSSKGISRAASTMSTTTSRDRYRRLNDDLTIFRQREQRLLRVASEDARPARSGQRCRLYRQHLGRTRADIGSTTGRTASGRGLLRDGRISEPKPHCVRSRARGSTSTSRFAQLRRFTLLYANVLTQLR
jgi:hypothetical protein